MIKVKDFNYYCFELFEEEIIPVKNNFGFWQLRLRGYFKNHKSPNNRELAQMGCKNGTKQVLLNGFSICGRKEQLEYIKAYILKELEKTKVKVYNHKVVEIPFKYGWFNIAYYMGRRSIYGYKFDFNFAKWLSFNENLINKDTIKELETTFEKIRKDYAWEREKYEYDYGKVMGIFKEKALEKLALEYSETMEEDEIGCLEELREQLENVAVSEITDIIEKRKIELDL